MKKIIFYNIKNIKNIFCHSINEMLKKKIIFLSSRMGRGKTKLINEMVNLLGGENNKIRSPSYSLKNIYMTNYFCIIHYDLHNIKSMKEILLRKNKRNEKKNIIVFEWGEIIEKNITERYIKISINLCRKFVFREVLLSVK